MNTPAIRVVGPYGSGRSAIAAALHKLLMDNGVTSEVISCAVDEQSWTVTLKSLLRGKLLPIIVSPNRPGDDIPPVMELMKELAVARKSAQDQHKKCQELEGKLAKAEARTEQLAKGNHSVAWQEGYHRGQRAYEQRRITLREELQKEFDRKLAAYKDATRTELKRLRHGSSPDAYMVSHTDDAGHKTTPHVILSFHKPSVEEIREVCGYHEGGEIKCANLVVPLVPPRTK